MLVFFKSMLKILSTTIRYLFSSKGIDIKVKSLLDDEDINLAVAVFLR